jgi:hypothetical protein
MNAHDPARVDGPPETAYDRFVASLDDLDAMMTTCEHLLVDVRVRAAKVRRLHQEGRPLGDLRRHNGPSLVQLLSEISGCVDKSSAFVRRRSVAALLEEGFSQQEIADMFGVTRQRVGTLVKEYAELVDSGGDHPDDRDDRRSPDRPWS